MHRNMHNFPLNEYFTQTLALPRNGRIILRNLSKQRREMTTILQQSLLKMRRKMAFVAFFIFSIFYKKSLLF
ncbi:hypothetical protein ASV53_21195 [Photobacterium sanguinicancri]|uniref:Uncharacterized protein n=1 Tax=Photobacterium sanguinicancri TaxID=875932 RepID=A0ABX4FSV9_9GAMM|nr:hypothetical protein ASV53_21195 [Photobacterium sanguinicancri]